MGRLYSLQLANPNLTELFEKDCKLFLMATSKLYSKSEVAIKMYFVRYVSKNKSHDSKI